MSRKGEKFQFQGLALNASTILYLLRNFVFCLLRFKIPAKKMGRISSSNANDEFSMTLIFLVSDAYFCRFNHQIIFNCDVYGPFHRNLLSTAEAFSIGELFPFAISFGC